MKTDSSKQGSHKPATKLVIVLFLTLQCFL